MIEKKIILFQLMLVILKMKIVFMIIKPFPEKSNEKFGKREKKQKKYNAIQF